MVSIRKQVRGFTLVEVLVALMVASIILAAAATMAGALSSGKTANDQVSRNGAYLLQLQTRLSDLIMRADAVVMKESGTTDGIKLKLNEEESTVYIRIYTQLPYRNRLTVISSSDPFNPIDYGHSSKISCSNNPCSEADHFNIQLSNVNFDLRDSDMAEVTGTTITALSSVKHITIKFDVIENGVAQTYCVSGTLRGKN